MNKKMIRSKIKIDEPWEAYLESEVEVTIYLYDGSNNFLVVFDQPISIGGDHIQYLIGSVRKDKSSSLGIMVGKKVECSFIKTTADRVSSSKPVDVSWWRGGTAFLGSIKVI